MTEKFTTNAYRWGMRTIVVLSSIGLHLMKKDMENVVVLVLILFVSLLFSGRED